MGAEDTRIDEEEAFGEKCRNEIGTILGVLDDQRFEAFWNSLRAGCLKVQRGITTTPNSFRIAPFDATLTERVQWLKANILNPIQKINAAISAENHPYFHHWESYGDVETPYTNDLKSELNQLEKKVENLALLLEGERTGKGPSGKLSHNDEIRHYIVYLAIDEVREHFPEMKLVRGNWDKEINRMTGVIPDYVRCVFAETTGQYECLDGQIQRVIEFLKPALKH